MPTRISLVILFLCLFAVAATAQKGKANPWVGEWKLDPAKSSEQRSSSTPDTIHIAAADKSSIRYTISGGSSGTAFLESYDGKADGQPHPLLMDGKEAGTVTYRWKSPKNVSSEITYPDGSKYSERGELSKDLKTLTLNLHPITSGHGEAEQTLVYTRQ
jgi:hypothetical protein